MNAVQQIELDILKVFVEICTKLELNYYLVCGSALGAAKYHGFIPWDDDLDVGLLRDDYERFLKEAPVMLPPHLFLQNYKSDPQFPHTYTKMRNSNTTFIETGVAHLKINHGIYIDIFPIDGYPKGKFAGMFFEAKKKVYTWMRVCSLKNDPKTKVRIRNKLFCFMGYHKRTDKTIQKLSDLFSNYATKESDLWCNFGNWQGKLEYAPKEQYGKGTLAEFEGLTVRIPEKYDAYLSQKYGDWRAELPEDKKKSHHFYTICDTAKPYTEYVS